MNIIFLDIDGVLNTRETLAKHVHLSNEHVLRLSKIVKETDASVVISSSWRVLYEDSELVAMLSVCGFPGAISKIIGKTKRFSDASKTRGHEIEDWISSNDVDNYVILDDDSDMLDSQADHFIKTNLRDGLQDCDVDKAIKILKGE